MFKIFSLASHAALLAFFIYLQANGMSVFGSDENKLQSGGSHGSGNTYHK